MPCDLPTDCALVIFSLSELADVAQLLLVDDFDAPSVHGDDALLCECREGADGITGGHVRQVGEIFACEVNLQRLAILLRGNLFVPDPRAGWVGPSVRFLKKYLKDNPAVMDELDRKLRLGFDMPVEGEEPGQQAAPPPNGTAEEA